MNRLAALCLLLAVALTGVACAKKSASSGQATGSVAPLVQSPSPTPTRAPGIAASTPAAPSTAAPKPGATVSKATFLAQANAICTTMNTQQSALPNPSTSAQALD